MNTVDIQKLARNNAFHGMVIGNYFCLSRRQILQHFAFFLYLINLPLYLFQLLVHPCKALKKHPRQAELHQISGSAYRETKQSMKVLTQAKDIRPSQ